LVVHLEAGCTMYLYSPVRLPDAHTEGVTKFAVL
jgi:hypothetical protein